MPTYQDVIAEFSRIETIIIDVRQEIQTLKNRVRAYKGWTTRYRQQKKELEQANVVVARERDDARIKLQELQTRQQELLKEIREGIDAKEARDRALSKLDEVIDKIEQYREICDRFNQMTFARKEDLIREAEKLFFDDPIIVDTIDFDRRFQAQMLTDRASICRDLLDN